MINNDLILKERQTLLGRVYYSIYIGRISWFTKIGSIERFCNEDEWSFFPKHEGYNIEYLKDIVELMESIS